MFVELHFSISGLRTHERQVLMFSFMLCKEQWITLTQKSNFNFLVNYLAFGADLNYTNDKKEYYLMKDHGKKNVLFNGLILYGLSMMKTNEFKLQEMTLKSQNSRRCITQ